MAEDSGAKYARRLNLLLEWFPHPDGTPWRGSEIEDESGGVISQQYFSGFKRGRYGKPGGDQIKAIADVIGFPVELFYTEPEQWPRILELHSQAAPTTATASTRTNASIPQLLRDVRQSVMNPRTLKPFTDHEIAERSNGRLSAEKVRAITDGQESDPGYHDALALSDVFNLSHDYWYTGSYRDGPVLDAHLLSILADEQSHMLLRTWSRLSPSHQSMLLKIAEQFNSLEETDQTADASGEADPASTLHSSAS